MPLLSGGQALVESLKREGVRTVFGLPGVQLDWAFDALYAARDSIEVVHTRHEQATAYMADGYARTTGQVGTCLVVPGPGLLNASAAVSTAYATNSQVLCVTGQIQSDLIGLERGVLHEVDDQLEMMKHITKWNARAMSPGEVPIVVHEAFRQLRSGRPRPVEIEIPPDVLARQAEVTLREPLAPEKEAGDPSLVEHAADVLAGARRPLIIAGGGVLAAEAWDELRAVAEALDAPVVMTVSGRGVLTDRHALATTLLALPDLLPTSDVVLAIGTRMLGFGSQPIRLPAGAVLVRVDADRAQLHRTVPAMIAVAGDAKLVLGALAGQVERRDRNGESRREDIAAINRALSERLSAAEPQASLGRAIRDSIPDDAIVIHESTQVAYWARAAMPFYEPRTYITSGYQGTLGCGFPTALGARVGNPDRTVVSLNGDGGFMFNVQEMATAVQHNIGVTIVVFNDGAFGNVKRIQEESFGGRTIGSELRNPDFVGLARSFGMPGVQAAGADALRGALREASTHDGPVLIEVPVGPMPNFQRQLRERVARSLSVTAG